MRYKITKAIAGLMAATFGAALYTLPSLLGLFYDDIPYAWALLALLGLVGFSNYWHTFQKAARREERKFASSIDLDRLAALYGMERNVGETDEQLKQRIATGTAWKSLNK